MLSLRGKPSGMVGVRALDAATEARATYSIERCLPNLYHTVGGAEKMGVRRNTDGTSTLDEIEARLFPSQHARQPPR